jgi:O-antigen/teichoic acid export membrane protein
VNKLPNLASFEKMMDTFITKFRPENIDRMLRRPLLLRFIARFIDENMREVIEGAAITFTVKMIGAGMMFGFNILVARMLGVEETGIFFLALTVLQICGVFARFGIDNAALKIIAANAELGRWGAVRGVYRKAVVLVSGTSIIVGVLIYTASSFLSSAVFHKPELSNSLKIVSVCVPAVALLLIHSEALKGLKRMLASQSLQSIILPLSALLLVWFTIPYWGSEGAVLAYGCAVSIAVLGGVTMWQRQTWHVRQHQTRFSGLELLHTAKPLAAVAVTGLVIQWFPLLVLGSVGTKADVGVFGAAVKTSSLTSLILLAVNSMTAPKFAALWAKSDLDGLESTAVHSAALVALLATPVLGVLGVFPAQVLSLFGNDFSSGAVGLSILAAGEFVNSATGSVGYLLIMTGHGKDLWISISIAAVLCIVLSFLIVTGHGVIGASLAVAVPLACQNLLASFFAYRKIGVIPCNYRILISKG